LKRQASVLIKDLLVEQYPREMNIF